MKVTLNVNTTIDTDVLVASALLLANELGKENQSLYVHNVRAIMDGIDLVTSLVVPPDRQQNFNDAFKASLARQLRPAPMQSNARLN